MPSTPQTTVSPIFILFVALFFQPIFAIVTYECLTPEKTPGSCIPVTQCKQVMDLLYSAKKPFTSALRTKLKSYQCGYDRKLKKPLACCHVNKDNVPKIAQTKHKNFKLLPKNCGILAVTDRTLRSNRTELFEFPWIVLLYESSSGKFRCAGTIINQNYILTAAHCVPNNKKISARIGEYDTATEMDCETKYSQDLNQCAPLPQEVEIEKVIIHPSFVTNSTVNDLALLRVSKMTFNDAASAVCLPIDDAEYTGTKFSMEIGWGSVDNYSNYTIFEQGAVLTVPTEKCKKKFENIVNDKQFCVDDENYRKTCFGDGVVLQTIKSKSDDFKVVQTGMIARETETEGKYCSGGNFPGVFTNIAYYMDWILNQLEA